MFSSLRYARRGVDIVSAFGVFKFKIWIQFNPLFILYHLYSYIAKVRTRSQLDNLSKEELIDELISVEDISSKLSDLTSRFDDFLRRYEILNSELTVSKNCNRLLTERIVQLERNAVSNAQYHHRESLEINPVPASIGDDVLENSACRALSLTSQQVKPDDLQACHRLKKRHCNS